MNNKDIVLVATAKGLIVFRITGDHELQQESTHFLGFSVTMVYVDERDGAWWAGVSHRHWGQKLHFSKDGGRSWHETTTPAYDGARLPNGKVAQLRQIWCMQHGGHDRPGHLWLGTEPGGLFHSSDEGRGFSLVKSLWDHPSRKQQEQWFGAGKDHPFIHSIVINPLNSEHIYVAVSSAGVFESTDGGSVWNPRNKGLVAAYLPNPDVEVGHDPHHLLMSPADPLVLWQQNHCGVFCTCDGGAYWSDVSQKDGVPNYGFAIAIDERDSSQAWVIPVESDERRIAPELGLRVYHTSDFGARWESVSDGLPQQNAYDIVLRQAFAKSREHFVFGTTNGNLYHARSQDMKWELITAHLAKVHAVVLHGDT